MKKLNRLIKDLDETGTLLVKLLDTCRKLLFRLLFLYVAVTLFLDR
jgi:hypothetical protein